MDQETSNLLSEVDWNIANVIRFAASARQQAEAGWAISAAQSLGYAEESLLTVMEKLRTAHARLCPPEATNDPHKNTTAASNPSTATSSNVESEELG